MKAFYIIAFAASVSSNIVNVVKRAEDCSVDACVRAHGSLARKGCIDGDINYADCICSLSDNFFNDLFECSQSCNQWEGTMIHGPDDLKDLYCAIALNTALAMDDSAPVTEKNEATTKSSTTSKTKSTTTRNSGSSTGELSSESEEPTETEETSSSADTGSKSFMSLLGLLAALVI